MAGMGVFLVRGVPAPGFAQTREPGPPCAHRHPSVPCCWWLTEGEEASGTSLEFLNRRSLGRSEQCWQSRSCVSVFNVMSSTLFRPGHLSDLLLVFSVFFLGAGCLPCHFPWSWMWRGGIHRALCLCVQEQCFPAVPCLSSFLALPFK